MGVPKGVLIEHNGVVNYASYLIEKTKLNYQSKGTQYSSLSFDAAVIEIFPIFHFFSRHNVFWHDE